MVRIYVRLCDAVRCAFCTKSHLAHSSIHHLSFYVSFSRLYTYYLAISSVRPGCLTAHSQCSIDGLMGRKSITDSTYTLYKGISGPQGILYSVDIYIHAHRMVFSIYNNIYICIHWQTRHTCWRCLHKHTYESLAGARTSMLELSFFFIWDGIPAIVDGDCIYK